MFSSGTLPVCSAFSTITLEVQFYVGRIGIALHRDGLGERTFFGSIVFSSYETFLAGHDGLLGPVGHRVQPQVFCTLLMIKGSLPVLVKKFVGHRNSLRNGAEVMGGLSPLECRCVRVDLFHGFLRKQRSCGEAMNASAENNFFMLDIILSF